jgi:hypothetical protein
MSTQDKRNKLLEQLDALKIFPNNKLVRQLRNQLKSKLEKLETSSIPVPKNVNLSRSNKLKRYHNYLRQIRNNFPEYSYNQIRQQFAKRRNQEDVSIPDAVWQNPSP